MYQAANVARTLVAVAVPEAGKLTQASWIADALVAGLEEKLPFPTDVDSPAGLRGRIHIDVRYDGSCWHGQELRRHRRFVSHGRRSDGDAKLAMMPGTGTEPTRAANGTLAGAGAAMPGFAVFTAEGIARRDRVDCARAFIG